MPGLALAVRTVAAGTSDNAAHGYNLTFAFPMILLIVIGGALYLLFTRPHRVPGHGALRLSGGGVDPAAVPGPDTARAAATAAGLTTAPGGGALETVHEAAGAHRAASADEGSGNVAPDDMQAAAAGPEPDVSPAADAAPGDGAPHKDEASE
jgi:hypothetical protein